ncbi:MAG: hypothetical protein ACOY3P_22605, partial [Planctomycetota bacterium]
NVKIFRHYGSSESDAMEKRVSLDKDEALVVFDLENGRRKEPLAEEQLKNVVNNRLAINHQVLAQQINALSNTSALGSMLDSRGGGSDGGGVVNPFAFNLQGAVGYQPVIITLPEGANFGAFAVISADRRYVRISSIPLFSGISEVNIFNTFTGENTTGQGGTGGQGFSGGGFGGGGGAQPF